MIRISIVVKEHPIAIAGISIGFLGISIELVECRIGKTEHSFMSAGIPIVFVGHPIVSVGLSLGLIGIPIVAKEHPIAIVGVPIESIGASVNRLKYLEDKVMLFVSSCGMNLPKEIKTGAYTAPIFPFATTICCFPF